MHDARRTWTGTARGSGEEWRGAGDQDTGGVDISGRVCFTVGEGTGHSGGSRQQTGSAVQWGGVPGPRHFAPNLRRRVPGARRLQSVPRCWRACRQSWARLGAGCAQPWVFFAECGCSATCTPWRARSVVYGPHAYMHQHCNPTSGPHRDVAGLGWSSMHLSGLPGCTMDGGCDNGGGCSPPRP